MWSTRGALVATLPRPRALGRFSSSNATASTTRKPRVLVLGSGWGANKFARGLDKKIWDVRVVSPANHFLFTPFLPSTAVGTLEFRAIQEPTRSIPGLREYYQAKARSLDLEERTIECEDIFEGARFQLPYDYLLIATGAKTNTFGTPGVNEREGRDVHFLKHLFHARRIRNRIIGCFERASRPSLSQAEKDRLLSFVVVGGGPTSCEFATELHDLLASDLAKAYPDLAHRATISIIEAGPSILSTFDGALVNFYRKELDRKRILVRTQTAVTAVEPVVDGEVSNASAARLDNGELLHFGLMVWSAGLAPVRFVENLGISLERSGRIAVDEYLRVRAMSGREFAIGDCAVNPDEPLPPLAQVAEQHGQYLSDAFNEHYASFDVDATREGPPPPGPVRAPVGFPFPRSLFNKSASFRFINVGAMASMGSGGGIVDMSKADVADGKLAGIVALAVWRGGYLSKQGFKNMLLIPIHWLKTYIFGRDITRF